MALQYDNFEVRRLAVEANLWPPAEEITTSTLSRLFAEVNEDDLFETCELGSSSASFDGDEWDYVINGSTVLIRWFGSRLPSDYFARLRRLLDGTRVVAQDSPVVFYSEQVRIFGDIPEGKNRDVGDLVKKRLLKGMKPEDRESLIGLASAGLNLRGIGDDFIYEARVDPKVAGDMLNLSASINFRPGDEPPRPGQDLDLVERQTQTARDFVANDLLAFSRKLFV
jgi:hypothetical protein